MDLVKLILGFLLKYPNANAKRLPIDVSRFYTLKKKILEKYGTHIGCDKQYIERICYDCRGLGEVNYKICPKCDKGIYDRVWVKLSVMRLGLNEFHTYGIRFKKRDPKFKYRNLIEGYVKHEKHNRFMTVFALYILLFLFDKDLLKKAISEQYRRSSLCRRLTVLKWKFEKQDLPF